MLFRSIAWLLPTNGIGNSMADNATLGRGYITYPLTAFVLPALIGSWRFTLFSFLAGPTLAGYTTNNINEWPAVWCLFSIGLVLAIIKTPLRYHLHTSDPWWMMLMKWRRRRRTEKVAVGAPAAIVTGGHGADPVDWLFDGTTHTAIPVERHAVEATHGAG